MGSASVSHQPLRTDTPSGVSVRSLLLAVILSPAGMVWIHEASLVQAPDQPYAPVYLLSVPPAPAAAFLGLAVGDLLRGGLGWMLRGLFGPDLTNGSMIQFG